MRKKATTHTQETPRLTFSEQVKAHVRTIKTGETQSYKEVAIAVGVPNGARAVAQVMAKNYDPTVPCHRVIKSDGTPGGYNRGGEKKKRAILESEKAYVVPQVISCK